MGLILDCITELLFSFGVIKVVRYVCGAVCVCLLGIELGPAWKY